MTEHEDKKKAPNPEPEHAPNGAGEDPAEELDFEPEDDPSRLVEDEAELGSLGAAQAKLKKLKLELAKAKAERQEYLDGWQRCKADMLNARKDLLAHATRTSERSKESLALSLIPALDSFDMAAAAEQWASVNDGFRTGMEHVRTLLLEALSAHGIERFGREGERYDALLHDAIEEREDVAGESGTVVRVLRAGYRMADRVLRPAQVIIKP